MAKTPLGRLDPRAFGLTGTTSDALDECRIAGVVPGSTLRATDAKARVVGQAITVLNQRREASEMKKSGLGEIEAHNLAEPGDVLVIQGLSGVSSMGGVSASVGRRQGEAGAIVDGAVRDIDHSRKIGYPDLVVADEVGVCFVPFERAAEVLAVAQRLTKREDDRLAKLDSGMPLKDWIKL